MNSPPDPTLQLGVELAATLAEDDFLGRWMAHYVAELIEAAESTKDPDAKAAAADMVLRLWSNRSNFFDRPYPLETHDRVFAALDYLGGQHSTRRFERYLGNHGPSASDVATNNYLQAATVIDDAVRDVIAWLLRQAAATADEQDREWVEAALHLDDDTSRALWRLRNFMRISQEALLTEEEPPILSELDEISGDSDKVPLVSEVRPNPQTPQPSPSAGQPAASEAIEAPETEADPELTVVLARLDLAAATISTLRRALTS